MNFFENKRVQVLLKGFTSSPMFYNFLIDTIPKLNIDKNKLEKLTKFKISKHPEQKNISLLRLFLLWNAIEKISNKSEIGLVIADCFTLEKAGIVGELFLSSKNLKESIGTIERFLPLLISNASIRYDETGNMAIFYVDIIPTFIIPQSAVECFLKICYNWTLQYIGTSTLHIKEIHCYGNKPKHFKFYKRNFPRVEVVFNSDRNYILLDKKIFYKKNRRFLKSHYQYILDYAHNIKNDSKKDSQFLQDIKNYILLSICNKTNAIESLAKELEMSVSSLKRRLKQENTTFQKLTEDIKRELSKSMLRDKGLSLEEVSFLLGYSEYSSFFRAFKKWHYTTPAKYKIANNNSP